MLVKLRVHPDSRRAEIRKKSADAYEIWVKSPAERGLANAEALGALAEELGVPATRIRLVKGGRSPSKIVKLL